MTIVYKNLLSNFYPAFGKLALSSAVLLNHALLAVKVFFRPDDPLSGSDTPFQYSHLVYISA